MGDVTGDFHDGGKEEYERVHEWEAGLPNPDDLTPLTQGLIPPELLSAFNIPPEPYRTFGDVSRASRDTVCSIHGSNYDEVVTVADANEEIDAEEEEEEEEEAGESESKKARRNESLEEADSATAAAKALKRPRLVWTPQLHKRFVDVVAHLGIKNAVPKTIMQLMNVDGLTRENVASHLQKYRLYLKRMQGVSFDGPANSSEHLFANSPAPASLPENRHGHGHSGMPIPMPIMPMPMPMPMPVMGTGHHGHMGTGMGLGMNMGNYNHHGSNQISHHHYQNHYLHYQYNGMMNYHQHYPSHVGDN